MLVPSMVTDIDARPYTAFGLIQPLLSTEATELLLLFHTTFSLPVPFVIL